jgi:hypothetical protein
MGSEFDAQVDDLALFFRDDDGTLGKRWVPHSVYADDQLKLDASRLPSGWKDKLVSEQAVGDGVYYIVNLARLLDPGSSPSRIECVPSESLSDYANSAPGTGDLVIVPWDKADDPHLVPRALYRSCPPIEQQGSSDLIYMALNEGVVLANMPKPADLKGFVCYLLSLVALRSGALDQGEQRDKTARALEAIRGSRTPVRSGP